MLSLDDRRCPLTRSGCATVRALQDDIGAVLHKQRSLLDHRLPAATSDLTYIPSPIARLSNEELLLIFEEALNNVFSDLLAFAYPRKPAILVTISHVSRRWRAVALINTCLWAHIFSCSRAEVELHMSRSGARPLSIHGLFLSHQVTAGTLSVDRDSAAIADALVENARRWRALHWFDGSANNIASVLRVMKTPNAYPMLENLEIILPEYAHLDTMRPAITNNVVLFPALKNIALICVHPMILGNSPLPSLENLRLKGIADRLLFSQLFSLLCRSPALRTLTLYLTLPTIDLLAPSPVSSLPRLFPNGPLRGTRFKLHQLVYLSLNPAPPSDLALFFLLLDLPALEGLDLHIHTDPPIAHWPCITPDGRLTTTLHSASTPSAQTIRLPSLRSLHVTYYITPAPASSPNSESESTPTTNMLAPESFPQLQHLAFPALTSLHIAHASTSFVRDTERPGETAPPPPPPPPLLRPFDALFHAPDFAHLTRLALARCALPLRALRDELQTRLPALEALVLEACPGAGALVCALAPGECDAPHEREHEPTGEGSERACGDEDAWVGWNVREVTVVRCADVRAGCLRRVVEARLRASNLNSRSDGTSTSGGGADDGHAYSDASPADATTQGLELLEPPRIWRSSVGGERSSEEGKKGERLPQRIAVLRIVQCARITRDEAQALAAIPGAPKVVWFGN